MNVRELTQSQQQPQAPKTHQKESTVRLTTRITMVWAPKDLSFTGLRTQLKSSARHILSNEQAQLKEVETVNLIENAQKDTFKAPCCCFENVTNTALTIVCTINMSIDCKKNKVSNPFTRKNILDCKSRQEDAWFVFCFKINCVQRWCFPCFPG